MHKSKKFSKKKKIGLTKKITNKVIFKIEAFIKINVKAKFQNFCFHCFNRSKTKKITFYYTSLISNSPKPTFF